MKISVITVCYNAQDLIENTVKSVIAQTYENIEYIVIDGVSEDSTLDILEKYRQKIDLFVSEKDTGIYNAMNKAVKLATGDFLIFMNAGDTFYSENTIQSAVQCFENSDAGLFFGDINVVEPNGSAWRKSFADIDKITLVSNCLCHQAVFYRRELFEDIGGYDETYKISADHDFNLKAIIKHKYKAQYIPLVICNFLTEGFSTNRNNIKNTASEIKEIALKYYGRQKLRYIDFLLAILRNITSPRFKKTLRKLIVKFFKLNI